MPDDALLVTLERIEAEKLLQFGLQDGGVDVHSLMCLATKFNKTGEKMQMILSEMMKNHAKNRAESRKTDEETNKLILFEEKAVSLQDGGL
ncbi:hypothetical protein J6U76_03215 [bacterium]|nr:hypothetical protein [bacterium]